MACYATSVGGSETLYGGSPVVDGQAYALNNGGTDDGTAISFRFQTRWAELSQGFLAQLWQLRLQGRGAGTLTVRKDYATSGGTAQPFDITDANLPHWDSGLRWGDFSWAVPVFQSTAAVYSVGTCRQFSILFAGSATTTISAPQLLGSGTAPTVGEFGLFGVTWLFNPLGLA